MRGLIGVLGPIGRLGVICSLVACLVFSRLGNAQGEDALEIIREPARGRLAFGDERFQLSTFFQRQSYNELLVHDRTPSKHPGENHK